MGKEIKDEIENEFVGILLSAMKKGMSAEEFFAIADTTMEHLRGKQTNETISKIMDDKASADDVKKLVASLKKSG